MCLGELTGAMQLNRYCEDGSKQCSAGGDGHDRSWCLRRLLAADARNFHGWAYRRFLAGRAGVAPEDEEQYATDCINANFSNYSAWHARESCHGSGSPASPPPVSHKRLPCCASCLLGPACLTIPSAPAYQ